MTTPYYRPPTAPAFGTPFAESYQASRGPESPGLEAQGQRWTAMSQAAATRPTSVLQQLSPSPVAANLSAPSQRDRLLPNGFVLNNMSNGTSSDTAENEQQLRMADTRGME